MRYKITTNRDKYNDNINISINEVYNLVENKNISPKIASLLIRYILVKNANNMVKDYINMIFHDRKIEKTMLINYSSKRTQYLI